MGIYDTLGTSESNIGSMESQIAQIEATRGRRLTPAERHQLYRAYWAEQAEAKKWGAEFGLKEKEYASLRDYRNQMAYLSGEQLRQAEPSTLGEAVKLGTGALQLYGAGKEAGIWKGIGGLFGKPAATGVSLTTPATTAPLATAAPSLITPTTTAAPSLAGTTEVSVSQVGATGAGKGIFATATPYLGPAGAGSLGGVISKLTVPEGDRGKRIAVGAASGAALGAAYGSIVPGPGTLIGGIIGAVTGGGSAATVICSELHRQGYISDDVLELDTEYRKTNIDLETYLGYLSWACDIVKLMQKSKVFTQIVRPFGVAWAYEMAHQLRPDKYKGNYLGKLMLKFGVPLCRVIGKRRLLWEYST